MIKVMIVDDERFAREGMKRTIDWKKYECEICGEASNGYEGIEVARKTKPDLIVTDISMPGINGIEMAQSIKEFLPECKFIVITGYDDFQYARGAVKINAFDFILKPIDEEEFLSSIEKVHIEFKKNKEHIDIAREKVLLDMMRGKIITSKLDEFIREYNIDLKSIIIGCIENDNYQKILEKDRFDILHEQNEYIKNIIHLSIGEICHYIVECHENIIAVIIDTEELVHKDIANIFESIQLEVMKRKDNTITIGVSNFGSINEMKKVYDESKQALKNKLYEGKGSIIYFVDLKRENIIKWTYILNAENEIKLSLRAGDKNKISKQLHDIYFKVLKDNNIGYGIIKQVSIEIVLMALKILTQYNISVEKVLGEEFEAYKKVEGLHTINELYKWVNEIIISVLRYIKLENINISESGLNKAIKYINEHYTENICLKDVSRQVYLSESYLSRRIKKVVGISFVEYITKLRIEKAIEYLQNSNIKVSEVALKVGYPDYRYFSRIFKKHTGYSPSEFSNYNNQV
ncbi:response regulator transcription factor [Clostridium ganghwense]|uniref:Stage 0 sporulation protein A homolog n=1 Tax=Clostridium ganghwense TaxID=312089 RepID=A0ABT4CLV8_9CLOT|nr:response regulator [Clostridium ganghwense]MCY6370035.1 response regulator [Clostridium ganghwense]